MITLLFHLDLHFIFHSISLNRPPTIFVSSMYAVFPHLFHSMYAIESKFIVASLQCALSHNKNVEEEKMRTHIRTHTLCQWMQINRKKHTHFRRPNCKPTVNWNTFWRKYLTIVHISCGNLIKRKRCFYLLVVAAAAFVGFSSSILHDNISFFWMLKFCCWNYFHPFIHILYVVIITLYWNFLAPCAKASIK